MHDCKVLHSLSTSHQTEVVSISELYTEDLYFLSLFLSLFPFAVCPSQRGREA